LKEDRRVKYTKMVLKESFITLLETKDISQITIKEICEQADINRATFYAHYSDQYDLMHRIENELIDNVSSHLSGYTRKELAEIDTIDMVEKIFEYIKENARLCKLMLSEQGDLHFQKRILMLVYEKNMDDLLKGWEMTKEEAEYIYSFTLTGCIGVIQKWFNDGMPESARTMAELLVKLNVGLTAGFIRRKDGSLVLKNGGMD